MTHLPWSSLELLSDEHDLSGFSCGLDDVDVWIREHGRREHLAQRIRIHVCIDGDGSVLAFFALKHIIVDVSAASSSLRRSEPSGMATGILLAQMGVRSDAQGGVGKHVVRAVLETVARHHREAPFRLLVVDAHSVDLLEYYKRFGFRALANDLRLVMKMSAVLRVVDSG